MKVEGKEYCDVSKISIAPINKITAKKIIVEKHYTHAWTSCRYALGVYHKVDTNDMQFDSEKLIGCIIYGHPVGRRAAASILDDFTEDNVLELTRLYIDDGYGSNIESYVIAQSFKWIKENDKKVKALLSYADNGQEHLGGIYQATNWIYQGLNTDTNLMPNFGISLSNSPYKWIHSRTVFSMWGSHNIEHLKREIGKSGYTEFWRMKESGKHRYIQILGADKKEKRELLEKLKRKGTEYPKNVADFEETIERHETYTPDGATKIKYW
jgi:hypothetical protein